MLKTVLQALSALVVLVVLGGVVVWGARSLPVPVAQADYQSCLDRAQAKHQDYETCPKTETVWNRGLSDPIAYYTLWLTFFTLALAIGGLVQSVLIGRQISLARDEFRATHRPRVLVQSVNLIEADIPKIHFEIVNGGETDAVLIEWSAILYRQKPNSPFSPTLGPLMRPTVKNCVVVPGQRETIDYPMKPAGTVPSTWEEFNLALGGGFASDEPFFLIGKIKYEGLDKIARITGFCRQYHPASGFWSPVTESQYEYAY